MKGEPGASKIVLPRFLGACFQAHQELFPNGGLGQLSPLDLQMITGPAFQCNKKKKSPEQSPGKTILPMEKERSCKKNGADFAALPKAPVFYSFRRVPRSSTPRPISPKKPNKILLSRPEVHLVRNNFRVSVNSCFDVNTGSRSFEWQGYADRARPEMGCFG